MSVVIWVSKDSSKTYKELCKAKGPCVAVQTINFLTKSDEYFESKFRFSFDNQIRKYKLLTILKKLGYKIASPVFSGTSSYYLEKEGERVTILTGILKNIT